MARVERGSVRVLPYAPLCALLSLHVAIGLLMPASAWAQSTGTVRGLVLDEAGAPLAGVTLALDSVSQGISGRGAVSDASGSFTIPALPPAGDYVLSAAIPGFATLTLTDIEVAAGRVATLKVTLQRQTEMRERVEVKARPQVVTLEETTTETRISAEFIDSLPILGRNYQDILTLAPGVTDVDGDGNPNIHGARDTDVITLVDGVSTSDPLTGKRGAELNIESIQEIEVKTSGALAEYGRAQGGFATILTKSGGNDFEGTMKFYWRGSFLDGDGAGADDPRLHAGLGESGLRDLRFNDYLPFLSVSGPIRRDHAWFFLSNEYIQQQDPVNALSNAFVTGIKEVREFAKITWQAGANHRLAFSLNYDPQQFLNQGLNSLTREESGYTLRQGGPMLTVKASSVMNPYVVLESLVSSFDERPSIEPTLDPDTNHNGILTYDLNGNGFNEASERDPGEDYDNDGKFDVFEDFNGNGRLDAGEDQDGDHRLTGPNSCEGDLREDVDCDGLLTEADDDRNGNNSIDDTPVPSDLYPYGELRPLPPDKEYSIDLRRGITSGPYYEEFRDRRRRFTLREDLSAYVPDYWGSHDLKFGFVLERENFDRDARARDVLSPFIRRNREGPSTIAAIIPAASSFENGATGKTLGFYAQDVYKPFPNLSLSFGVRFDREIDQSFGYSFFEPAAERARFDLLMSLAGNEAGKSDASGGDNNGVTSLGVQSDQLFAGSPDIRLATSFITDPLKLAAISRLTRHHIESTFTLPGIANLFPGDFVNGQIDPRRLAQHGVFPQRREAFAITNNNLAPRLGISWDPSSTGRTKIFATWGRYYDKLFLSSVVAEEGPDVINRYYLLDPNGANGLGVPNHQIGRILSDAPPSTHQVDRQLKTPYSDELTLGFEREIAPEVALSLRYISRRFRDQLQDIDVNHSLRLDPYTGQPLDDFGRVGTIISGAATRQPDGRPDLYIQNFFFNQVLRLGNFNEARYRAIEFAAVKRLARRWELQGSYTYSRVVGGAEDFMSRLGNDPSTVEEEFGYLDYDQRHVVKLNAITFLPHDWQLGLSMGWSSGLPYSIISRFFALDNADYQQFRTRYGRTLYNPVTGAPHFEPLRRNSERNAAVYDVNVRAKKALVIGRHAAAAYIEVFNLLNSDDLRIFTYSPDQPDRFSASPNGVPVQEALQLDATRRFGRRFQFGFQFDF